MCVSIHFHSPDCHIETVGTLREICPELIVRDGYDLPLKDQTCLCPVDVPQTLLDHGFKVWRSAGDPMAFEAEPVRGDGA